MPTNSINVRFPREWKNGIADQAIFYNHLVEMGMDGMGGIYQNQKDDSFNMAYKNKELPVEVIEFLESMSLMHGLTYRL